MRDSRNRAASGVSRRGFMGGVAAAAGAAAMPGVIRRADAADEKSRVVVIRKEKPVASLGGDRKAIAPMVDQMMCSLTGKKKAEDAWASMFKPDQRIGIKVNTLFAPVTTSPALVDCVTESLIKLGVKPGNIIVWDRCDHDLEKSGFKLSKTADNVRIQGIMPGRFNRRSLARYSGEIQAGPIKTRLCKIITDDIDVLINIPFMKHHGKSGVTASMKNHLGTVPNASAFHVEMCKYLADLSMMEPIRTKTKLIIMDATTAQYDGGPSLRPQFRWKYSGLMASTDTVAIDRVAAIEIKKKRNASGKPGEIRPPINHIIRAGELGLGQADPAKIDIVRIEA